MRLIPVITLILALISAACSAPARRAARADMSRAEALFDSLPDSALAILSAIPPDSLSDVERHFYDFLTVKARDKAYVSHTSDSLIREVISHFDTRRFPDSVRAEVRYYGGRVYSDLGDYPTALRYFNSALELLPKATTYHKLRCHVLSQTGRILDHLRLYDEAIPYLEEVIDLEVNDNDSINEVHNLRLLATTVH